MDIKDVQKLITEKKDNVLVPMVQSMSENFAKAFETGVEVGIEIGKAISPDYSKVWHTQNDNPPQEDKKIIFLWGQSDNIKDLNEDVGRLRLICGEKVICGWTRWPFEDVKLWAYVEDLLPESLDAY